MGFIEVMILCAVMMCIFICGVGIGAVIENNRQAALDLKNAITSRTNCQDICYTCLAHHQMSESRLPYADEICTEEVYRDDNHTPIDLEQCDLEITQEIPKI